MKTQSDVALVVLSGGQDSTTCLFWALQRYTKVHAITFDYGQRHKSELVSAQRVGIMAKVASHEFITLGPVLAGSSPLTNPDEVLEQYKDHASLPGGLEKTFVPGRNLLFLSIAANRAYVLGAGHIITGICQEDNGGYPDCTQAFADRMEATINESLGFTTSWPRIYIHTPLMNLTKAQTVMMARDLGADCWTALAFTHTSYDGAFPPVGHDHATLLRAKGFEEANLPDPLIIRAVVMGLMDLPLTKNYDLLGGQFSIRYGLHQQFDWDRVQVQMSFFNLMGVD